MTTEELIEKLKAQPQNYAVQCFWEGIERDDLVAPLVDIHTDIFTKQVLLEFTTTGRP